MEFINNTRSPALNFEGIDQLKQSFHVIVTRHTYTWNEKGLLQYHDEQDGLCMEDVIVNKTDLMSGVIEESDLCHYKPKCDILVVGHAYRPIYTTPTSHFLAKLHVQTPDKYLFEQAKPASKYIFAQQPDQATKIAKYIAGSTLIDKTLAIYPPRIAELQGQSMSGRLNYDIINQTMPERVSLNPTNSFGGYCMIEAEQPTLQHIAQEQQIPEKNREHFRVNPNHGLLGYFEQDHYNPYGKGYITADYAQANKPKRIELPQIHSPKHILEASHLAQMSDSVLDAKVHTQLVNGFGIRNKSHPERHQYLGRIDQTFIESEEAVPEGFDFAIWNNAYPDQQVEKMVGNEWINLTNLCDAKTLASKIDEQGNIQLTLYLPETIAYLLTNSNQTELPESEVPMKLDSIIIRPDEQKVHMVWRGIIAGEYDPKTIILKTSDRAEQQKILQTYFTRKGDIIRPYE